jgi:hypothetical protein
MIDPGMEVRDFLLKPGKEPLGDFPEEYAGLGTGVKKFSVLIAPQISR